MTVPMDEACVRFDAAADELAVGAIGEPERSTLMAHASRCARCGLLLDELADVADRLLLVGPEAEPATGFESRAVARMTPATPRSGGGVGRKATVLIATAAAVVALIVGLAIGAVARGGSAGPAATRTAALTTVAGARVGSFALVTAPSPHVIVTLDSPRPSPGIRTCQLERADGTWVSVGTWTYQEIDTGVWADGVDRSLLQARAMRVLDDAGNVVATATL